MKKTTQFIFAFYCSLLGSVCLAQQPFRNCSAIFLDNKMVVDEYSPEGKCSLDSSAIGILTAGTVELWPEREKCKITSTFKFMVAIRDANSKTLMMYSTKVYEHIKIQDVMKSCQKGFSIVVLTLKDEYALLHNEILVK